MKVGKDPEALLRTGNAARVAGFSTQHLHQLVRAGKLRAVKLDGYLYFRRRDVQQLAAQREAADAN
jgi:hypothetical protein